MSIVLEIFAFIFAIFVMLPMSYICEFFMSHMILTYTLTAALFIWTILTCRYECKIGDIKMRDNEISPNKVNFKTRDFIFKV